ncbi:hypothetical protein VTJ83DRAFT_7423 [Remersonia thermophila]|uniref:Uncharacterized protein n=1 Tax=Remersonia thermophila TaxID=72144 RepID=A0ABR4D3L4_9PEZI
MAPQPCHERSFEPTAWITPNVRFKIFCPAAWVRYINRVGGSILTFGWLNTVTCAGSETAVFGALSPALWSGYKRKGMSSRTSSASSAAAGKGKGRAMSPRRTRNQPSRATKSLKRPVSQLSDASDGDDGGDPRLAHPSKARKTSTARRPGPLSDNDYQASSSSGAGSSSWDENCPADVDSLATDGNTPPKDKTSEGPIDYTLPPLSDPHEMIEDMIRRINPTKLSEFAFKLSVGTICSGTDAPIYALKMIQEALYDLGYGACFEFEHHFSAEIEPAKQGFIRRNLDDIVIFRDVIELAQAGRDGKATTAGGSKTKLPTKDLDILFAGCSCVDYSNMNHHKPSGRVPALDRHLKDQPKRRARGKGDGDAGAVPIKVDETFVNDLDLGLDQLLSITNSESAMTFFAAIKLITIIRPKFVILENVYSAPWDMYTDQIFPKIGYAARVVKLDSKDYYLPQTRQRGYLVAVDSIHAGVEQAIRIVEQWEVFLNQCKRAPSAPITSFLRPSDDPGTIQARSDMVQKNQHNIEWALSSLRHADARHKNKLRRDDNPFSMKAMRNGKIVNAAYQSHSWMAFWESQVARVIDLMDINFAVALKAGFDLGYKTYMIDASQNVDRNQLVTSGNPVSRLKTQLGIVGCITPSGLPVITDLMRPVTGTEALALQGLPVDELVLSTETQSQLRDLAGNAMSLPVVGAATLALLLAARETGTDPNLMHRIASANLKPFPRITPAPGESLVPGRDSGTPPDDLAPVMDVVKDMVRLCNCPRPAQKFFSCKQCGATACSSCRGNPKHDFSALPIKVPSITVDRGKVRLRDLVPMTMKLDIPSDIIFTALSFLKSNFSEYASAAHDVLSHGLIYYFEDIRVTKTVTVSYKSAHGIARLVLSPDSDCFWYVYIAPWHPNRVQLSAMLDFNQPMARGKLDPKSLSKADWAVWVPGRINLTLGLAKDDSGTLAARDLSFTSGQVVNEALLIQKNLVEERITGTYRHHPDCGSPGNTLHIKQATCTDRTFIMWNSGALTDPDTDHFVWTNEARRMEQHEHREVLLHATTALRWDLDSVRLGGPLVVFWTGYWSSVVRPSEAKPEGSDLAAPTADVYWGPSVVMSSAPCHSNGSPVANMPVLATVSASLPRFPEVPARLLAKIDATQTNDEFVVLPPMRRDGFLRMFAHLGAELRRSRAPEQVGLVPHLCGQWVPVAPCLDCSVTPPVIAVQEKRDQKKAAKDKAGVVRVIIEDPDAAARFEQQYQKLPNAVAVAVRLGPGEPGFLDVRISAQPKTLASRALAYLRQAHPSAARGGLALVSEGRVSFTVSLDHADPPLVLAPFRSSVLPCGVGNMVGLAATLTLRPSQKLAVDWMLLRERASLRFAECEIEEEVVAPLGIRVMGKAEWENRFPYSARGGVVAHEIGYGKTVVSLALIDYMRAWDTKESITERQVKVDGAWLQELPRPFEHLGNMGVADFAAGPEKASAFFIHLSATLIIVPKHISQQWAAEAEKFLGLTRPKVLIITTLNAFYGTSMEELEKAEIIIVSGGIFTRPFLDRLHGVTRQVTESTPATLPGRAREAWYRDALRHHRILTAFYLAGIAAGIPEKDLVAALNERGLPGLIQKQQADIDALLAKQVQEIDRQLYKKGLKIKNAVAGSSRNAETESATDNEDAAEQTTAPRSKGKGKAKVTATNKGTFKDKDADKTSKAKLQWTPTCLHNCSFARIIWDEYTYDGGDLIHLFVSNAVANAKWLLSGTPELFTLEHVCRVAAAFGIHLARPEPRMMPGLPPVTAGPVLDPMSKSEEFHVFSSRVKSASLAIERHEHAHKFVAAFFRGNALDAEINIPVEEHVAPLNMTTLTAAHYHMVNQELLDAGYDFAILPSHARTIVDLKGADLMNRDGPETAKMLLGLLGSGLGQVEASIDAMNENITHRVDVLSDQMKLLWDKTMWLRRWILALMAGNREYRATEPVANSLTRVKALCDSLTEAVSDNGSFEDFGGKEMFDHEAAVIAGVRGAQTPDMTIESLKETWGERFRANWPDSYNENKALFTWFDFFSIEDSNPDHLTDQQIRLLAEDMCWLRYKINPYASPLTDGLPNPEFLGHGNAGPMSSITGREIPSAIEETIEQDKRILDGLSSKDLREWVQRSMEQQPKTAKEWDEIKKNFQFQVEGNMPVKAALIERLTELNLKFPSAANVQQLKDILCAHEYGRCVCENYRDGRAPPDRYREFQLTMAWGAPAAKQIDATNEELKRTMVHLAKTIEDLRATMMEAKFAPEYAALARSENKDVFLQKKRCCSCLGPLGQASSSFLIVACGHLLCRECKAAAGFYCPVEHCPAFIRKRPVLRCSQIPTSVAEPPPKAESIACFIKNNIPADEYVLVFAQYRHLVSALAKAFDQHQLSYVNLAETKDNMVSKRLEEFKIGKAGQILLLDMDSETSAGSNLTNATHIIFANPYVHPDPEHQIRTVSQARGRCIRTGQERKVNVYHFMMRGTVEEETLRKYAEECRPVKEWFDTDGSGLPWWMA